MKAFIVRSLLVVVSFVLLVQLWIFASLAWWRYKPVETTMFMRIDYWSEPSKPIQHEWRDYDEISEYMKKAIVAAEDGKFMQHHGFDWDGIQAALGIGSVVFCRLSPGNFLPQATPETNRHSSSNSRRQPGQNEHRPVVIRSQRQGCFGSRLACQKRQRQQPS